MRRELLAFALGLAVVACSGGNNDSSSSSSSSSPPPPASPPPSSPPSDSSPPGSELPPPGRALQRAIISQSTGGNTNRLYIINEDGTDAVTIAQQSGGNSSYKGTLPSGRIVYEAFFSAEKQSDLFSVNPDGTGLLNLTNSPESELFETVSPSGRIIFNTFNDIFNQVGGKLISMAADGGQRCEVGPAGHVLAVTLSDHVISQPCATRDCSLFVGHCTGTVQLTTGSTRFIGITSSGRIAYTVNHTISLDPFRRALALYTNSLDGSDQKQFNEDTVFDINAHVHGDSLIWVQGGTIRISSSDAAHTKVLAQTGRTYTFLGDVSPAGRLVYQVGGGNNLQEVTDLYSVRLDGTDERLIAGTARVEVLTGMTQSGRVLYQAQPDPTPGGANAWDLRSVQDDGSSDVGLGTGRFWNALDAVTRTNRVVYAHSTDHLQEYNVYATNGDGTENRFLLSRARYLASTTNDRIVFGSECRNLIRTDVPQVRLVCDSPTGVVTIKSDGTGLVSLASDSAPVGFAGLYGPPKENTGTD